MAETDERPEPEATKEPYSTPQLVRYGTVEELTRGGPATFGGDAGSTNL
jgi:hypothetical protein